MIGRVHPTGRVHPRLIVQKRMPVMECITGAATLQDATARALEIRTLERDWHALDARIAFGRANPRSMPLDSYEIALVEREALERRLEALRAGTDDRDQQLGETAW